MAERFWRKNTSAYQFELCIKATNSDVLYATAVIGSFDMDWLMPVSVEKIDALLRKFYSIPEDLIFVIPDDVLEQLPLSIIDCMC